MMGTSITLVISGYHGSLSWVRDLRNSVPHISHLVLYAKDGNLLTDISDIDCILPIQNVGINMYDLMHYIVNNYECLHDRYLFLKSNSFTRVPAHCDLQAVIKVCHDMPLVCPLEVEHPVMLPQSTRTIRGGFLELNNDWLLLTNINRKYFYRYNDYMNFFFKNYQHQKYLRFAPGGNIFLDSKLILSHPRYLYERLLETVSYDSYPIEMMYLERALLHIFSGGLIAREESDIEVFPRKNITFIDSLRLRVYSRLMFLAESFRS